jgi:hypothetical protein
VQCLHVKQELAIAVRSRSIDTYRTVTTDFTALLKRVSAKFASQQALAEEIGITAPRLNRALNHGDYSLNVANCLRLARVAGEPPSVVLRAAGKGDIADLIESLYGAPDEEFSPAERTLVKRWRRLDDEERQAFQRLMRDLPEHEERADKPTKRKRSA